MFDIFFGIPEIRDFWVSLKERIENGNANKSEIMLFKKLKKTLILLQKNPRHPGLKSHEIEILSRRYGRKVWESYLENRKPAAGRIFWVYYPPGAITIIGLEPHPNNNKHSYETITLSAS